MWKQEGSARTAFEQALLLLLLSSLWRPDESRSGLGGSDAARTPRAPRKDLGGGAAAAARVSFARRASGRHSGPALSGGPGSIHAGRERVSR